ncbi:DNA-binding protein [Mycobacterium sp. smrl_JER01]|uniref:DNA-binding protein n=1 Tax=Mycobacterium sp. smrl_JER01 TaxID=3402633 RepID=UPI003AD6DC84
MSDLIAADDLPALATPAQVAAVMQTTVDALAQDRYRRRGLPWIKVSGRVRYARVDVLAYLAANRIGGSAA